MTAETALTSISDTPDVPRKPAAGDLDRPTAEPPSNGRAEIVHLRPRPTSGGRFLNRLRGLLGRNPHADPTVRETLEELIEEREEGDIPIAPDERELLKNILSARDITVHDVMVPRGHIEAIDIATPYDQVLTIMSDAAHSRMPVYRETLDDVIGMLHIKDVLAASLKPNRQSIETLLRTVLFVPPSMRTLDLLLQMRQNRTHMALVIDEYGGIDGLVTIEDLVEQIVGEIEDEHDEAHATSLERRADGSILADAATSLDDLEDAIGAFLRDEERETVNTLGGLVSSLAGQVPAKGDIILHPPSGISFEVVAANPRRVQLVRLTNLPDPSGDDG